MIGLLLAAIDSVVNVLTDVSRKKVLDRKWDAALVSVWCKLVSCLIFLVAISLLRVFWGTRLELPRIGQSFGISPGTAFLLYVSVNAGLEGTAILLNLRALQLSPLSYCVPFMALTPLFLLPAGIFFLHESVSEGMILGVGLVVIGALVVNRRLFAQGFFEPLRAIVAERGSRYMLGVALLLTVTNVLDKWFLLSGGADVSFAVKLSRSLTLAVGKCAMLSVFFAGLTIARLRPRESGQKAKFTGLRFATSFSWTKIMVDAPVGLSLAGLLEAVVLLLQLTALQFIVAALVISIKRAGMIFAVFLGWIVFNEKDITDRVIASLVMTVGVLLFFLTKPDGTGHTILSIHGSRYLAVATVAALAVSLYATRRRATAYPPRPRSV
jgi:drug/metabolite transporter (DMT)-like permease